MTTYRELKSKADALLREAEQMKKKEMAAVIAEVKGKIREWGLTAEKWLRLFEQLSPISGLRAGGEWCRVVHGGGRCLRRTKNRSGLLGAHQGFHLTRPVPSTAALRGTFRWA